MQQTCECRETCAVSCLSGCWLKIPHFDPTEKLWLAHHHFFEAQAKNKWEKKKSKTDQKWRYKKNLESTNKLE